MDAGVGLGVELVSLVGVVFGLVQPRLAKPRDTTAAADVGSK